MKCDSFNGTKIVSGLFDDDECIEEFNESWLDATESISGTKVFLIHSSLEGLSIKQIEEV